LADDIYNSVQEGVPTAVVIPAGTGTTSLFLHRRILDLCKAGEKDIKVFPVACVAGREDLERQMRALSSATWSGETGEEQVRWAWEGGREGMKEGRDTQISLTPPLPYLQLPKILDPFIPFASVDKRILSAWREAKEAGMYLDLVYGAVAVHTVTQCWKKSDILNGRQVMFVNTGGLEGVASMMNRYKHAGMVEDGELY
jgi:1-aminocyclopropane-1-carboxylate deaminase/D-cysteine desulfhydrase-like pyridoxal-dependent ACC family enzyme